jgi:pimeloyl-ACP methyl ester carboxylesterase
MESANRTGPVHYRTAAVGGVNVFYREAGPDSGPVLLLLHGFPNQAPTFKAMQQFLRERRPPTLVATGANDEIFPEEVGRQILTDHPGVEYHALRTGHFALEDKAAEIAALMRDFLARVVPRA